jgi:hypothetical protein
LSRHSRLNISSKSYDALMTPKRLRTILIVNTVLCVPVQIATATATAMGVRRRAAVSAHSSR